MHSLLHCHFESGLRALAVAQPAQLARLRPAFESPAYKHAAPAGKRCLLDQQAEHLTRDLDIFTPRVFAEVARRFWVEMTSSGVAHVDLRIGVIMRRWPWINSPADAITAFRAELPGGRAGRLIPRRGQPLQAA